MFFKTSLSKIKSFFSRKFTHSNYSHSPTHSDYLEIPYEESVDPYKTFGRVRGRIYDVATTLRSRRQARDSDTWENERLYISEKRNSSLTNLDSDFKQIDARIDTLIKATGEEIKNKGKETDEKIRIIEDNYCKGIRDFGCDIRKIHARRTRSVLDYNRGSYERTMAERRNEYRQKMLENLAKYKSSISDSIESQDVSDRSKERLRRSGNRDISTARAELTAIPDTARRAAEAEKICKEKLAEFNQQIAILEQAQKQMFDVKTRTISEALRERTEFTSKKYTYMSDLGNERAVSRTKYLDARHKVGVEYKEMERVTKRNVERNLKSLMLRHIFEKSKLKVDV
jgi:hypothetical protein